MMFDFKPSVDLVRQIVENLQSIIKNDPELSHKEKGLAHTSLGDVESIRTLIGKEFVRLTGMYAQRARYQPALSFPVVVNGAFPKKFDEYLGGRVAIPAGERGNELMALLAQEFLVWVKEGDHATLFDPRAPLTKFTIDGENVTGHVRPTDPPIVDPTFFESTDVDVTFE